MPDQQLPARTTDSQTGRASRFLEKVSLLRGRIRFPARKSRHFTDPAGGTSPYLRQTRSMDAGMHIVAKPYMSQPLLGLHDMNDNDENEGSDRSGSPRSLTSRAHVVRRDFPALRRNIDGLPTDQSVTSFILPVPVPPSAPTHAPQRPHTSGGLQSSGIPGRMLPRNSPRTKALSPSLRLDNLPSPSSHRFGANGISDARLSPTIISRQPPLPILNLPKLVVSSPESPAQARTAGRDGQLRSMPALPLRGQDVPRDRDDASESDDDDDEFHDAPSDDLEDGANTPIRRPRGSMDSIASIISGAHASEQSGTGSRHGPHFLPEVDVSRIDLTFIGDAAASRTSKGKGRARETESDPSQTPTLDDYFSAKALTSRSRAPHAGPFENNFETTPHSRRPGISKHASRSMIDLILRSLLPSKGKGKRGTVLRAA
ncbi:hypothetical protein AB1N83_002418 [Pleurotus pulmonarius]